MLVFVRAGELRRAEWEEIDFEAAEWRIPAEKMKMKAPHIVPLADWPLELLAELRAITGYKGFDLRKVCQVLTADGWMRKDGKHNRIKLPRKAVRQQNFCGV